MKITVFTSNQPRHLYLIQQLASICDEVYAIQECNTVFPGQVQDFFNKTPVMQEYFKRVMQSEKDIFGSIHFLPKNVHQLALKSGDLNKLSLVTLHDALQSDIYVVFGSSFIKDPLIDFLIEHKAYNIHMGVSPYYRGSSCNFWAPFDGHPELIGATIHMLSRGLDSGDMLYHALPKPEKIDCFQLGMKAVKVAHDSLVSRIQSKELFEMEPVKQNKNLEYRYTRNRDFTDEVALNYLQNQILPEEVYKKLNARKLEMFQLPFIN